MAVVAALLQPLLDGSHPRAAFMLRLDCLAAAARGMPPAPVLPSEPGEYRFGIESWGVLFFLGCNPLVAQAISRSLLIFTLHAAHAINE